MIKLERGCLGVMGRVLCGWYLYSRSQQRQRGELSGGERSWLLCSISLRRVFRS